MAEPKTQSKSVAKVESTKDNGADFVILPVENSPLFKIGFEKGGVVPKDLQSLYTSKHVATKAIEAYQAKRG